MTELSLPAKAYLLACDVGEAKLRDRARAGLLIRGAALTDLVLRGRVTDADGRVAVTGAGPTGDLVLDELLAEIGRESPRKWKGWVRKDARGTLESLESQLDAAGVIDLKTARILGLFPSRRPVVRDPAVVERLRASVDQALRGPAPASDVDTVDAALTALVAAVELRGVVSGRDRRRHRDRIEELGERGGDAVPALRKLFRELRAVRASAASSSGGS
ncbi:GPP34 family phosphoprotein [Amycolatopsis sp. WAC 04197]|uniref:GOLPH3/VPS74 family protein n=1 Tax=Amycolatopsis sp. WAC 04197 TaxID=2203199 RepID=UPI000F778584|nr:GPP34 family phosphoprotein [Amycolatopsis sp. WAC 04197]RSN39790.1 GPP34 family phosphoprotein [Amycolatopsis sp. WAC 04197]